MVKVLSTSTSPPIYHSNFFLEPKHLVGANPEEEEQEAVEETVEEEAVEEEEDDEFEEVKPVEEEAHELDASIASLIHRAVAQTATRDTSTADNVQQAPSVASPSKQQSSQTSHTVASTISNTGSSNSLITWERVMLLYITAALIFMCVAVAYYGARISQNMSSISQKLEETNLLSIKANKTKGIVFKPSSSSSSTRLTKVPLVLPSTVNTSMNWISFHRERLTLGVSSKVLITGTFTYEAADGIYLLLRAKIGSHYSPMTAIYQPPGTKKVSVPVSFMAHETLESGKHPVIFEAKASCLRYGKSCNTDNEVFVEDMKQLQVYLLE